MMGDRQAHGHLAVLLLAEAAAILARHADRVNTLLHEACVIDDPGLDRRQAFEHRQHQIAHLAQNRLVRPRPLADQVQQRLMLRPNPRRRHHRRHGLDALALAGQKQPHAVSPERTGTVGMTEGFAQRPDIGIEPRFAALKRRIQARAPIRNREPHALANGALLTQTNVRNFVTQ